MKRLVAILFCALCLTAGAQNFYVPKIIDTSSCKLGFYNADTIKFAELDCDDLVFWENPTGSIVIRSGVLQVTVSNTITSPTFSGLPAYLESVQLACKFRSNDTTSPLYIDSTTLSYYTVLSASNTPPGSPATGATYLVGNSPTGAWAGHAKDVAEWSGSAWVFYDGLQGDYLYNSANALTYQFRSGNWVQTAGIPILNNGNSISSGVRIGTNNNRSLTFETLNTARGRFDSLGRFYVYNVPAGSAGDTFLLKWNSVTGRFTQLGQSSIGGGGGSGANIYNSDGVITDMRRLAEVRNSTILFVDSTHASGATTLYNTFSVGDSSALITRDLQVWFPWNGTKTTVLYYNPTAGRIGTATIGAAELNGSIRSQVSTYNENAGILSGIVSVIDTATMLQTTDFTYSDNGTGEYITMQLTGDSGFVVDPVVFDGDAVFSVRDTASRDVLSVRPGGKVFVDAPVNNGVTKIIGWDDTDSTLTVTDMPGGAAADPDVALIETINVVAGVTDFTIEFDSLPTKYKSFKIEFNNVSALGDYVEAFYLVVQLGTSGGYRDYGYAYKNQSSFFLIDGTNPTTTNVNDTSSAFLTMQYAHDQDTSYSMSGTIDIVNPFAPTVGARTIKSDINYYQFGALPNFFNDASFGICKNLGQVTKIKIDASADNKTVSPVFAMQTGTFRLYGYK